MCKLFIIFYIKTSKSIRWKYNYIDIGVLSLKNLVLPRKVRNKKRKSKRTVHVDKKCHKERTYEDFGQFVKEHPDYSVVEMDSVEGTKDSSKVLLTLFFRNSSCMLGYLRESNTARSVNCLAFLWWRNNPKTWNESYSIKNEWRVS